MSELRKFIVIRTDVEGCLLDENMKTRVFASEQEAQDVIDLANLTDEELGILRIVEVSDIVEVDEEVEP